MFGHGQDEALTMFGPWVERCLGMGYAMFGRCLGMGYTMFGRCLDKAWSMGRTMLGHALDIEVVTGPSLGSFGFLCWGRTGPYGLWATLVGDTSGCSGGAFKYRLDPNRPYASGDPTASGRH